MTVSLEVVLDDAAAVYRPGDEIAGAVIVRAAEACACEAVVLVSEWFTQGEGNDETGEATREELLRGPLPAGEQRLRFRVRASHGPLPYAGQGLTIGWRVRAWVDVPWAIDPQASAPFRLAPRADAASDEPYHFGPAYRPPAPDERALPSPSGAPVKHRVPLWAWPLLAVLLAGMIASLPGLLIVLTPIVVIGAIVRALVRGRVGEPEWTIEPRVAHRGGAIAVWVRFAARREVELTRLSATLSGAEVLTKGSGKSRRTIRKELLHTTVDLVPAGQRLRAGQVAEGRATLAIPVDAALTFAGHANAVQWAVELRADLPRSPDWSVLVPVTIRPGAPRGA